MLSVQPTAILARYRAQQVSHTSTLACSGVGIHSSDGYSAVPCRYQWRYQATFAPVPSKIRWRTRDSMQSALKHTGSPPLQTYHCLFRGSLPIDPWGSCVFGVRRQRERPEDGRPNAVAKARSSRNVLCCAHSNASDVTGEALKLGVMHLTPIVDLDHLQVRI